MTFYKDALIVALLSVAFVLHTLAALFDLFIKNQKYAKYLNTGLTILNILLHFGLIFALMRATLPLNEAVLVFLISVFFHTLLYFISYNASAFVRGRKGGDES